MREGMGLGEEGWGVKWDKETSTNGRGEMAEEGEENEGKRDRPVRVKGVCLKGQ